MVTGHSRQVKPKILRFSIAQSASWRIGIVGIPQHNDCRAFTPLLLTKRSLRVEGRKRPGTKGYPSHFTQSANWRTGLWILFQTNRCYHLLNLTAMGYGVVEVVIFHHPLITASGVSSTKISTRSFWFSITTSMLL